MEKPERAIFYVLPKYFWILGIFVKSKPILKAKQASKNYVSENPELAFGYSKIFWGYLFRMNMPWVLKRTNNLLSQVIVKRQL